MHFLVGTAIVLAIIYFMIVSPGFRVIAIFLLIGGAVLIGVAIQNDSVQSQKREREREAQTVVNRNRDAVAKSLIAVGSLEFSNTSLKKDSLDWKFRGTVKNNSLHTLNEIHFRLRINDCADTPCVTIGESDAFTNFLIVPPGQARSFEAEARFPNLPQSSRSHWFFDTVGTRGLAP